jgi:hypothetical protein
MRRLFFYMLLTLGLLTCLFASPAFAQSYSFRLEREVANVYLESDGTMKVEYIFNFINDSSAPPIEFVDVGMHNEYYDLSKVTAFINGQQITHVAPSEYVDGAFELGLGSNSIPPGASGVVSVSIEGITRVLYDDSQDSAYASAKFSPTWFDSSSVHGSTDLTVIFHLPPGVKPEEPRWHASPSGWPSDQPSPALDTQGRVQYTWHNPNANGYTQYIFGASFPRSYVPAESITKPSVGQQLGISEEMVILSLCCGGFIVLLGGIITLSVTLSRRRKLAYLPPKIAIEGHGIKRGLTAVEAAVLLETPLDRVLTMVLFSLIKKGGARVASEEPLKIERLEPTPPALRPYEEAFLKAMIDEEPRKRRQALQQVMIELVKSVQKKMKGFSLRETKNYYQSIMKKAWQQVEEAETPEIRSKRYDEGLEWTMLDSDFDDRTRRTFQTGPVFIPSWWWLYRPSYSPVTGPTSTRTSPSGAPSKGLTLPTLPGADFAASMVNGVQNTASSMVSNLVSFTNGVTKTTNPPPPPSKSSWSSGGRSGGCACACACACAGCACACAGGGR